jgi:hypothetical protein
MRVAVLRMILSVLFVMAAEIAPGSTMSFAAATLGVSPPRHSPASAGGRDPDMLIPGRPGRSRSRLATPERLIAAHVDLLEDARVSGLSSRSTRATSTARFGATIPSS